MDFVAIDFETANQQPSSACQLAAVVVKESQIVEERSWLIHPPGNRFSSFNIAIHGIRPNDVADAPRMHEIWNEVGPLLAGQLLIAHNARFDISVLHASLDKYEVLCHPFEFHCTRHLARAAWPGRNRYGLKPLGNWLGIEFKHHDALEDARCCAKIALTIESSLGGPLALSEFETRLGMRRGKFRDGTIVSPRRNGQPVESAPIVRHDRWGIPQTSAARPVGAVCEQTIRSSSLGKPLADKRIVMLGPLRGLSMEATHRLLQDLGATVQNEVQADTNYVVTPGISVAEAEQRIAAFLATSDHLENRSKPRVLSERQFRALLPGGTFASQ